MKSDATLRWFSIDRLSCEALEGVLRSWEGTPYHEGQRARKVGVDCVQLILGTYDILYRVESPSRIPRVQVDAALHSPRVALAAILRMRSLWHGADVVRDGTVRPGDIVVTRAEAQPGAPRRPAHAMIAGVRPWTAWHAIPRAGVVQTSIERTRGIVRIYRPRKKDLWRSR